LFRSRIAVLCSCVVLLATRRFGEEHGLGASARAVAVCRNAWVITKK